LSPHLESDYWHHLAPLFLFHKVTGLRVSWSAFLPAFYLSNLPSYLYRMPTSSGSHSHPSRPPRRFPESELPTQGASSVPRDLPVEAEGGVDVELAFNPLGENPVTGPASSLPRQEDTPMSPLLPPIASLEEVIQAQIRELDHDLREAFSRLADADLRNS
jgi:hypothetical protein